jgi:peptidoglycan hydrolase-like protein with peptidoglycan-binding domain
MKKIIGIFCALSLFISPYVSFAQQAVLSVDDVNSCTLINRSLRYRASDRASNSNDVLSLQIFLKEKGYLKAEPNGFFGDQTLQSVRAFQRDNGLFSAGFVGPLTRDLIHKEVCPEVKFDVTNVDNIETIKEISTNPTEIKTENVLAVDQVTVSEVVSATNIIDSTQIKSNTVNTELNSEKEKKDKEDKIPKEDKKDEILPRIMFWPGKVNQHIDPKTGLWVTDPDGVSGGYSYLIFKNDYGNRELEYCKKWYPDTISIKEYKLETINTWKERGNVNNHTSTKMSYLCIQPAVDDSGNNSYFFRLISPDGGEVYTLNENINVKWKNNKPSSDKIVNISLLYKTNAGEKIISLVKNTLNDGEEQVSLALSNIPDIIFGKNFKIYMHAEKENGKKEYEDYSKDFFTINNIKDNVDLPIVNTNISSVSSATTTTLVINEVVPVVVAPVSITPTPTPVIAPDPVVVISETVDLTPRIGYWGGKVNQYVNAQGIWTSDPDGLSGASIDKLTYCRKWYPATTSVQPYKTETINTFKRAKNFEQSDYSTTITTDQCIGGQVLGASTEKNPNLCSLDATLMKGMKSPQVKCLQQKLNQKGYTVVGTEGGREVTQFGLATLSALKKFQTENNLKADGIVGLQTRALLNK